MENLRGRAPVRLVRCAVRVLLAATTITGVLMLSSQAASAQPEALNASAGCLLSGTIHFSPPLGTEKGGTRASRISGSLLDCTSNSGNLLQFYPSRLTGRLTSSPFTCSSSSSTTEPLSGEIRWRGKAWPKSNIAATQVSDGVATGSFAGTAVVSLQVPSALAGCAGERISGASVSGTVAVGQACGQVGDPVSLYSISPPVCGAWAYRPTSIATGPDGALWFTNFSDNLIGRTTTAGVTTLSPLPFKWDGTEGNGGITSGSDGALWFLADSGLAIERITTSGSISTFPLPSGIGLAFGIASGPDGALWFTIDNNRGDNAIGRLTTSGQFTIFTNPGLGTSTLPSDDPQTLWDIVSGPDGALWFSSTSLVPAKSWIGRITTTGVVTEYQLPFAGFAQPLVSGPDGAIWFGAGYVIGRVTTSGQFSEYTGQPGQITGVAGLADGTDGALWFTNDIGTSPYLGQVEIGRITTDGTITTYSDPNVDGAMGITAGPDGAMWFDDIGNDAIGRITVP